jgi:hypothetical protein
VKWRYYLSGVDTEGDYYEVHAYEVGQDKSGVTICSENTKISNFFGSGLDGKQNGHIVNFQFKDASAIRRSLCRKQRNFEN